MNKFQEFDRRIAEIHDLRSHRAKFKGQNMDIRHEEFKAMTDVFLSPNYNRNKLEQVERLQVSLREGQMKLFRDFQEKTITADDYVDSLNALADQVFAECERILGTQDFEELFGAPASERLWHLDKNAFLNSQRH